MPVYRRYFKSKDVVVAGTEEEARQVDWSDASDTLELDYLDEVTPEAFKRWHESWREYVPAGDDDCRTLAEIFEGAASNPVGKSE
jgi:hypothetical protein